jgi:hypothetical protein
MDNTPKQMATTEAYEEAGVHGTIGNKRIGMFRKRRQKKEPERAVMKRASPVNWTPSQRVAHEQRLTRPRSLTWRTASSRWHWDHPLLELRGVLQREAGNPETIRRSQTEGAALFRRLILLPIIRLRRFFRNGPLPAGTFSVLENSIRKSGAEHDDTGSHYQQR